ncbi:MAG TPA: butyrate kinase, partial [Bacteroides sp.]|nr:butyrate kinase [Bacteroides sp.]
MSGRDTKRIKLDLMKILVINPGSTSTKLAVYENENPVWRESIAHPSRELAGFHHINEQYEYRRKYVHDTLAKAGIPLAFDAV